MPAANVESTRSEPSEVLTGVWADLVSQERAVATLRSAVVGAAAPGNHAMTHAWLITGPPGSGRSNAARAFAAALQCPNGGCGNCQVCRTVYSGAHPDVTLVQTQTLSIGVDEVRDLVVRAGLAPVVGNWQILVVEDADRVTEQGADALLKSLEEPAPRTVWLLCAPTPDDVLVTIRSRCRKVSLQTPRAADAAALLVKRDGVDQIMAIHAARAAQGHIGRARALARDEQARNSRHAWLRIPSQLTSVGACLQAAGELVKDAAELADQQTAGLDAKEQAALRDALGFNTKGTRPKQQAQAALKQLEEQQKARAKRLQRDWLDRVLTELTTWYRDVLAVQTGAVNPADLHEAASGAGLINSQLRDQVGAAARASTPADTLGQIDAILAARQALESNVAPLLAIEAMLLQLAGQRPS